MKKNKKDLIDVIPEGEKLLVEHEKGSVGEFIELLKEFPADGKIDLDGSIYISKDTGGARIYPREPEVEYREGVDIESCDDDDLDLEEAAEVSRESYADHVAGKFCLGFDHCNPEMISTFRSGPADKLLGAPIMTPNTEALEYEENYLLPGQVELIDEIRHHNVYMAECMAEVCRRSISAMLEYNTQVLSRFAHATTKEMCKIIDNKYARNVLDHIDDDKEF